MEMPSKECGETRSDGSLKERAIWGHVLELASVFIVQETAISLSVFLCVKVHKTPTFLVTIIAFADQKKIRYDMIADLECYHWILNNDI